MFVFPAAAAARAGVSLPLRASVRAEPEGERASVQLTGSDYDLTRPLFVRKQQRRPSRLPGCLHVSVSAECTFHTCDRLGRRHRRYGRKLL